MGARVNRRCLVQTMIDVLNAEIRRLRRRRLLAGTRVRLRAWWARCGPAPRADEGSRPPMASGGQLLLPGIAEPTRSRLM